MLLLVACGGESQATDTPAPEAKVVAEVEIEPSPTKETPKPEPTTPPAPKPNPTKAPTTAPAATKAAEVASTPTEVPPTPTATNKLATPQTPSTEVAFQSVGGLLLTCPTEVEIVRFESDLDLDFSDTNVRPYACLDGVDPDGPNERLATYQALRVMRFLTFDEPPPWTNLSLYDWFNQAIKGMKFFEGDGHSSCCDTAHRVRIKMGGNMIISNQQYAAVFVEPRASVGLMNTIALFIHEGRHGEPFFPHTCGYDDLTLGELGAWGVQHYYYLWLADHTPLDALTAIERETARYGARQALGRICEFNGQNDPTPSADAIDRRTLTPTRTSPAPTSQQLYKP